MARVLLLGANRNCIAFLSPECVSEVVTDCKRGLDPSVIPAE